MRRSPIPAAPPLWLAPVRPYPKDDVQHAAYQESQTEAIRQAEVAAALCEASPNNLAAMLKRLKHFGEAKSLLRKTVPVARRVLGEGDINTLKSRWTYARALYEDADATLDDVREAVTTLEETARTARRVLGGAHPLTVDIEGELKIARAVLRPRETPWSAPEDK